MKYRLLSQKIKFARLRQYAVLSGSAIVLSGLYVSAEDKVRVDKGEPPQAIIERKQAQSAGDKPSPQTSLAADRNSLTLRPGAAEALETPGSGAVADQVTENDVASVDMSNVQRVRLRAAFAPEIAGEYIINNGSMSIPYLGRFSVRGKHLADLEVAVGVKLSRALHRDVQVSLEIERFQPFYIVGNVSNAGEQEWRQGMTLIQAIGSSGGLAVNDEGARGVDASGAKLRFTLAQLERLKAERDDVANWEPSDKLLKLQRAVSTVRSSSVDEFVARQKEMLAAQRKTVRSQVAGLELERAVAQQEMKGAERQVAAVQEQLAIARQIIKDGEGLRDKKLLRNTQFMDQKIQLLTAQIKATESEAAVDKSRARIAAISRQIEKFQQDRQVLITERIEELERTVEEIESAKTTMSNPNNPGKSVQYFVARKKADSTSTFTAELFSEILPGDVIIISETQQPSAERSDISQHLANAVSVTGGAGSKSKRTARAVQLR